MVRNNKDCTAKMCVKVNDVREIPKVKELLLFLAGKISSFSFVGFAPSEGKNIFFFDNSRMDVLTKLADIFSEITFLKDDMIAISEISVSEAKYYLNAIAAFLSGRFGVIGPLSFIPGEADACLLADRREIKIVKINRGAVSLDELSTLVRMISLVSSETVKDEVNSAVEMKPVKVVSFCKNQGILIQEA